jgi:PAS domain S-box-containing protein
MDKIISKIDFPIIFLNKEKKIKFVNSSFEKLSGYSRAELTGKKIEEIGLTQEKLKKKDGQEIKISMTSSPIEENFLISVRDKSEIERLKEVIYEKENYEKEWKAAIIKTGLIARNVADGNFQETVKVEELPNFTRPLGRNINKIIAGMENTINLLKQREKELIQKEEELKREKLLSETTINESAVPIVVTDRDWKWILVNPAFEAMFGYKKEEVINKKSGALPVWTSEEYEKVEKKVSTLLKEKGPGKSIEFETRMTTKEGKDKNILVREIYLSEESSKETGIGFIGFLIDITDIMKKEEEIINSKLFADQLFHRFPQPSSLFNPVGERVEVNKAAEIFFGKTRKDMLGTKIENFYDKDDTFKLLDAIDEAKEAGYSECNVMVTRYDGKKVPAMIYFSAIRNAEGEITHLLGTVHPMD